jgi:AraC-like DNA-binding protein
MRPTSQPTRVLVDLLRLLGWPQREIGGDKVGSVPSKPWSESRPRELDHEVVELAEDEALDRREPRVAARASARATVGHGVTDRAKTLPIGSVGRAEGLGSHDGNEIDGWGSSGIGPTSWRLERNLRQVTFAQRRELSVFTETTSARLSAPHAHPAWTLLLPVDGGTVTVIAGDAVRLHEDGVLLAPQCWYRAATDGPHVAVYANAWRWTRPDRMRPRTIGARAARRVLDALDVDSGTDLSAATVELTHLVGRTAIDSRLAFVIEVLPAADRLDVLAAEVGISPSRLRTLAREEIGVPLTQLRLWSRLAQAISWLPYGPTAAAAAAAGFADQAHFTRTARRFLGRTPGGLSLRSLTHRPPSGQPHNAAGPGGRTTERRAGSNDR